MTEMICGIGTEGFEREVAERFGMMPNFFRFAPSVPGLIEELWRFAKSAYLDSALPSLFKERLFVHLSRFCEARYCIIRHVGFLIGEGRPAGDVKAVPETIAEVVALLGRPLPDAAALDQALMRLEAHTAPIDIPAPQSQAEADLFDALTVMFVTPGQSFRARGAVRAAIGDIRFEVVAAFLAFVRTAHYWTETHPDLAYEADIAAVMQKHPDLASLLLDTTQARRVQKGEALGREIANHAQTETVLRTREAELARVQEIGGVAGVDIDLAQGFVGRRSPEYMRLHGLPPEVAVETHEDWLRRLHPDDRERADRTFREAVAGTQTQYRNEFRIIRPDNGSERWIFAKGDIERDAEGRALRLVGAHIDITERKRAEEALRESQQRLQLTLDAAAMGTFIWYPQEDRGEPDAGMLALFGQPSDGTLTKDALAIMLHPEDAQRYADAVAVATDPAGTGQLREDIRINLPDGSLRWIAVTAQTYFDGEPRRAVRMAGTAMDVTARKAGEEALRDSEQRFRQFGATSSDVLWIRNAQTLQWEYLSPAFDAVYGISREMALQGDNLFHWVDLIVPEDRKQALECISRARDGERVSFEFRIRRPADGQIRWMRNNDFPMLDQYGQIQRIGGIGRDITELKSAVDHHQLLLAELQHRVRNTLAVIRSIVRRTAESSETVDDFANHLDGRIGAFARVQVAMTRDPLAGFDLAELISEELRACAAHEGEQFTLEGPPVRLKAKVAESMGLAIHELATNAIKHGAFTSERGRIQVRWWKEAQGGEAWLAIDWKESGMQGRPVTQGHEGFGTKLLQQTLQYELGAKVARFFEPSGFRCTISIPLDAKPS
jgi:PAS domain S-box-containing protein